MITIALDPEERVGAIKRFSPRQGHRNLAPDSQGLLVPEANIHRLPGVGEAKAAAVGGIVGVVGETDPRAQLLGAVHLEAPAIVGGLGRCILFAAVPQGQMGVVEVILAPFPIHTDLHTGEELPILGQPTPVPLAGGGVDICKRADNVQFRFGYRPPLE